MTKIDLPLKEIRAQLHINPARLEMSQREDHECSFDLVRTIVAWFPIEKQEPIVFEYGGDWWQMFKQRWFPAWTLKRWPVKMCRKEWTVETIYPNLQTQLPPHLMGPFVTILVNDKPVGSFLSDPMGVTPRHWNDRVIHNIHDLNIQKCRACGRDLELMFKL